MQAPSFTISNLQELRYFVHHTLCEQNELERNAFRITERILVRGKNPCGIFFYLHGPRNVRLTAVWESERNTVLFYGSSGERLLKTQLTASPELEVAAT